MNIIPAAARGTRTPVRAGVPSPWRSRAGLVSIAAFAAYLVALALAFTAHQSGPAPVTVAAGVVAVAAVVASAWAAHLAHRPAPQPCRPATCEHRAGSHGRR